VCELFEVFVGGGLDDVVELTFVLVCEMFIVVGCGDVFCW